jgi:hypothetical protein
MSGQNTLMSLEPNLKKWQQLHLDVLRHFVLILKLMKREISLKWRSREEREGSSDDVVGFWNSRHFCYVHRTDWYHATECEDFHVTRQPRGNESVRFVTFAPIDGIWFCFLIILISHCSNYIYYTRVIWQKLNRIPQEFFSLLRSDFKSHGQEELSNCCL